MAQPPATLDELGIELTGATAWDQRSIDFAAGGLLFNASQAKHIYKLSFASYVVASGVLTLTGSLETNNQTFAVEYIIEQVGIFFGVQKFGVVPAQDLQNVQEMFLDNDLLENTFTIGGDTFVESFEKIP